MMSAPQFTDSYIHTNTPVVVSGLDYDSHRWTPEALRASLGDLQALVYGDLFDLEDVQLLSEYLDDWFDSPPDIIDDEVPYVRWYNQLRDVDFAWGDEAFARMANSWRPPTCLAADLVVPPSGLGAGANPVTDAFPYRGILVAAQGARTRLHRDPFCSDAVVCQFHGEKRASLYHPSRSDELLAEATTNSFGGFVDVRNSGASAALSAEPDFEGIVQPGEMIYIPHGWLHDVVAVTDSISVTWNFVHAQGAAEFHAYLATEPESDSELEILRYFQRVDAGERSSYA